MTFTMSANPSSGTCNKAAFPLLSTAFRQLDWLLAAIDYLIDQVEKSSSERAFIGLHGKEIKFHNMEDFERLVDIKKQRPKEQWWMDLRPIARTLAQPSPRHEIPKELAQPG